MPKPKIKRGSRVSQRRRASKQSRAAAVYVPQVLRRPEGDLEMMLASMADAELQAQVQAETAVKVRRRIIDWLRARRLAGDIPLRNVAAAVGRHEISLGRLELGTVSAKDSTLKKLLSFYGFDWTPTAKIFVSPTHAPKHRQE